MPRLPVQPSQRVRVPPECLRLQLRRACVVCIYLLWQGGQQPEQLEQVPKFCIQVHAASALRTRDLMVGERERQDFSEEAERNFQQVPGSRRVSRALSGSHSLHRAGAPILAESHEQRGSEGVVQVRRQRPLAHVCAPDVHAAGTATWTRTRGSSTPWWARTRCLSS
jgi:hypothetical protein